jgi:predicted PolB exonuclease-like 3'-5' exonuclease
MQTLNYVQNCLFFDIETTVRHNTFAEYQENESEVANIWLDKCKMNDAYKNEPESMLEKYGSLYPEYGKIICISYGYFDVDTKKWKVESLNDSTMSEKEMLMEFGKLCNTKFHKHILSGYNIKRFDIPYVYRRMLANHILPPSHFDVIDKKPWEIAAYDLYRVWTDAYTINGMCNFDVVCQLMGVPSPKQGEVKGESVKEFYYDGKIDEITEYCRRDVQASIRLALSWTIEKLTEPV